MCFHKPCTLLLHVKERGSSWLMSAEAGLKQPVAAAKPGAELWHGDLQAKMCVARPKVQPGRSCADAGGRDSRASTSQAGTEGPGAPGQPSGVGGGPR